MKTALKKFASFYLNTWWFPPAVAFFIIIICINIQWLYMDYHHPPLVYSTTYIVMPIVAIGVPVSWGWLLAKKHRREALQSFLLVLVILFISLHVNWVIF